MIFYYNLIIVLLCLWIVLFISNKFIRPALWNQNRFKLFELRDRLGILAMKDEIDQHCDEYNNLMLLLNHSIVEIRHFELTEFIRFVTIINRNDIKENNINSVLGNVKNQPIEYKNIFKEYLDILCSIFKKKLRLLFFLLPLLISVLGVFKFFVSYTTIFTNKKNQLDSLSESLHSKRALA